MTGKEAPSGKGRSPTRDWVPDILRVLADGPAYSTEIAKRLGTSRYNLYRYLDNLEEEGLVDHDIVGRMKLYRLTETGMAEAGNMFEMNREIRQSIKESIIESDLPMHIQAFTQYQEAPKMKREERRTNTAVVPVPGVGPYRDILNEMIYKMEKEEVLKEFEEIEYIVLVGPKRRR